MVDFNVQSNCFSKKVNYTYDELVAANLSSYLINRSMLGNRNIDCLIANTIQDSLYCYLYVYKSAVNKINYFSTKNGKQKLSNSEVKEAITFTGLGKNDILLLDIQLVRDILKEFKKFK